MNVAVTGDLRHPAAFDAGESDAVICGGVVSIFTVTVALPPPELVTFTTWEPLARPPGVNAPRYGSGGAPSSDTSNDSPAAPVTVISGVAENQPDAGVVGDSVTTGAGGGGGVGAKPGPLFDAHDTLPAPSTA